LIRYTGVSARNDESKQIYNYRLSRASRLVENAYVILPQKYRLLYDQIQLSPENADKVVLAAWGLHNFFRNVSVEDCVIENTDAALQLSCARRFRRCGGSASEEAMSVRKNYRQYFENIGSLPWQLEAIRRGKAIQK
jgi:hypothetical protein